MDALCEGEKEGSHMSGYGVNVSHDSAMTEEAERKRRQNEGKALPCSHLTESYRMGGCACGDGGGGDGPSTLIVVILVVGMVGIVVAVGWQMWKTHKAAKGAAAAGSAVAAGAEAGATVPILNHPGPIIPAAEPRGMVPSAAPSDLVRPMTGASVASHASSFMPEVVNENPLSTEFPPRNRTVVTGEPAQTSYWI